MESSEFLKYYAQFFDCVGIDSTYYRIPSPSMMEAVTKKVPKSFKFTVKTPSTFTHQRKEFLNTLEPFRVATKPILRKGMLACYLAQFPSSFHLNKENLQHTQAIAGNLDAPLCVELRQREWQNEDVYEFLRENEIGFVNVDLPRFKSLPRISTLYRAW